MEDDQGLQMIYQVIQDEHHLSQIWNKKAFIRNVISFLVSKFMTQVTVLTPVVKRLESAIY